MNLYKINKIAYSADKPEMIFMWLDQIIERMILDQLDTSNTEKIRLITAKYTQKH